jgi:hypothetical protein
MDLKKGALMQKTDELAGCERNDMVIVEEETENYIDRLLQTRSNKEPNTRR